MSKIKVKNVHTARLDYKHRTIEVGGEFEADDEEAMVKRWLSSNLIEKVTKTKTKKEEKPTEEIPEPEELMAEPEEEKIGDE